MISPLPDTPLQKALQSISSDVSSTAEFTPAGQLLKRLIFATRGVQPTAIQQTEPIPAAIRSSSALLLPEVVGTGAAINAAVKTISDTIHGTKPHDISAAAIEGGRNAALLAPALPLSEAINAPMVRTTTNGMKTQTLVQNIAEKLREALKQPPKYAI